MAGPSAAAAPATPPHTANALARAGPWKVVDSVASDAGNSSAAPIPSTNASPSTSIWVLVATDARNEPTAKRTAPVIKALRTPKRSPMRPPMISRLPRVSA
jgi:hypothetical protein